MAEATSARAPVQRPVISGERLSVLSARQPEYSWFRCVVVKHSSHFDVQRALGKAVRLGDVALVNDLLDEGALGDRATRVRQAELNGALVSAVRGGRVDESRRLLDEGASVYAQSSRGYAYSGFSVLSDAVCSLANSRTPEQERDGARIVELLFDRNAHCSLLEFLGFRDRIASVYEQADARYKKLCDDVRTAVQRGDVAQVHSLLEGREFREGAESLRRSELNKQLIEAVKAENVDEVRCLLKEGASAYSLIQNKDGQLVPALSYAHSLRYSASTEMRHINTILGCHA